MKLPINHCLLIAGLFLASQSVVANDASPAVREKAAICMSCHGPNGNSTQGKYPSLSGQNSTYIYSQLKDFMAGRRKDPEMSAIAATIADKAEALELAKFFSALPQFQYRAKGEQAFSPDASMVSKGAVIAERTICTMCHGAAFKGGGDVPRVQGQQPDYVRKQIRAFRDGDRNNDGGSMKGALGAITDDEIEDLVHFIATQ
jgi:cytochrome c553